MKRIIGTMFVVFILGVIVSMGLPAWYEHAVTRLYNAYYASLQDGDFGNTVLLLPASTRRIFLQEFVPAARERGWALIDYRKIGCRCTPNPWEGQGILYEVTIETGDRRITILEDWWWKGGIGSIRPPKHVGILSSRDPLAEVRDGEPESTR